MTKPTKFNTHRTEAGAQIICADSLEYLKTLPDNSVDSVVTDPPYEIGFMGKGWDNTGIAYSVELWKECLRVLKPGGHALVFGATRTYHRVAVAIEDAGFEIRDSIHWMYGSGFPKSMAVDKAIDKAAGAERKVIGRNPNSRENSTKDDTLYESGTVGKTDYITAPATPEAQQWAGWGTALKPAHEPIVVARKPVEGTVAQNVLTYGVGGINIDGSRVGSADTRSKASLTAMGQNSGWNAHNNREVIAGSANGRFPANILLTHSAECEQVGEREVKSDGHWANVKVTGYGKGATGTGSQEYEGPGHQPGTETVSAYRCVPGCPVAALDEQSGEIQGGTWNTTAGARMFDNDGAPTNYETKGKDNTKGGASRFFTNAEHDAIDEADPFYYSAKAPKKERPVHPETGKGHPTVKPLEVMRWLIKLVTPAGGTVLEPFAGSGATVEAALLDGYKIIAIDITADHMPLIDARIDRVLDGTSPGLKPKRTEKKPKEKRAVSKNNTSSPNTNKKDTDGTLF